MEPGGVRDRRLVRATLQGDTEAFGELVERHQRLVAGAVWRYGTPREEIEDVVHEVFIKAYGGLRRYRPEHAFSTWLYRLAANHAIDHARRTRRQPRRADLPAQAVHPGPGAGERLELRERAALVRAALADVPPRYREALYLVYVEGLKVAEAARSLGLPTGTVKTRLMRGRAALRRILVRRHPEHFGEGDAVS